MPAGSRLKSPAVAGSRFNKINKNIINGIKDNIIKKAAWAAKADMESSRNFAVKARII
jgi:hypothetical protein